MKVQKAKCSVCGKSSNKCTCKADQRRYLVKKIGTVLVLAAIPIIIGVLIWQIADRPRSHQQKLDRLKVTYLASMKAEREALPATAWWYMEAPAPNTPELDKLVEKARKEKAVVEGILAKGAGLNLLTREIAGAYKRLSYSLFYTPANRSLIVLPEKNSQMEVCFLPAEVRDAAPATFAYNGDANRTEIFGTVFSEPVLAGGIFHEFGHALWRKQYRPSATAKAYTDSWISEEVVMHELDGEVTNRFTGGEWFHYIDSFIEKAGGEVDYRQAVLSWRRSDNEAVNQIDGCDGLGTNAVMHAYALRQFVVAFRSIDHMAKLRSWDDAEVATKKIEAFRYVHDLLGHKQAKEDG